MNSTELITALIALLLFGTFIIKAEKELIEKGREIETVLNDKRNAIHCARKINSYYANSGGILEEQIKCEAKNKHAISGDRNSTLLTEASGSGGKIIVETEQHYR